MTTPTWRVLLRHIIRTPNPKYNLWTSCINLYVQREVINSYLSTLKNEIICKTKSGDIIIFQVLSMLSLDNFGLISFTNFNAQFLYSLTMCMLHYNPRHVSSINMPIFRRINLLSQHLVSSLYVNGCTVCRMRADCRAEAVIIQFVLLTIGMLMLERRRGL